MELSDVEATVAEVLRSYNRAQVHCDPFQAALLIERLQRQGVPIRKHEFTVRSNAELALTLHRLLRERRLQLPKEPALRDELVNVRLRETSPGVYRLDHDQGRHDDMAVAVGVAVFHLTSRRPLPDLSGAALDAFIRANESLTRSAMGEWR